MSKYTQYPHLDASTYRAESGKYVTEGIFLETATQGNDPEFLTWSLSEREKEKDGKVLPSAYQIVVWSSDEYDAAMKICGSIQLWGRFKGNKRIWNGIQGICPGLGTALEVQKMRLASEAMKQMQESALNGNVAAQKAVFELNRTKNQKKKESSKVSEDKEYEKITSLHSKLGI